MSSILELSLDRWEDRGSSKVRLSYLPRVPYELFRIYLKYRDRIRGGPVR